MNTRFLRTSAIASLVLACLSLAACRSNTPSLLRSPHAALDDRMDIRDVPAQRVLQVRVQGSYAQYEQVISDLSAYAMRQGLDTTDAIFIGVYPDDPRTTPQDQLQWTIAMPIGNESIAATEPYEVTTWPAFRAMVYETSAADLPARSHASDDIIADKGLRQSAPTRMLMLDPEDDQPPAFRVFKPVQPVAQPSAD